MKSSPHGGWWWEEDLTGRGGGGEFKHHFLLLINTIDPKGQFPVLFFIFKTTEVEEVSDNSRLFPKYTREVWAAAEIIAGMSSNFIPVKVSLINFLINVR